MLQYKFNTLAIARYYFTVTLFIIVVILQHEGCFDIILGQGSTAIIKLIITIIKALLGGLLL